MTKKPKRPTRYVPPTLIALRDHMALLEQRFVALQAFQEKILRRIDLVPTAGQWLLNEEDLMNRAVRSATFRIETTLEANRKQVEGFHAVLREFIDRVVKLEQRVPVKVEKKPVMRRKKR